MGDVVQMAGLFNPIVKESVEMLYQNEVDYVFDSGKFERSFGLESISYQEGIRETAKYYKQSS